MSILGSFRAPFKTALVRLLERTLNTHEGKEVLVAALRGQLSNGRGVLPPLLADAPYADLGRAKVDVPHEAPIFITARFRSGSTLLWSLFRHVPDCTAFYEPLNERRWFDPSHRGTHTDTTHRGVTEYWREYGGLVHLSRYYRERWIDRDLYMDERHSDPELFAYIGELIAAAPVRAVLQFNRVDFRLAWLRRQFPQARLIHLYRHPRDQWCSSLVDPSKVRRTVTVPEFEDHDHYYLLSWARDLSYHFPFLNPRAFDHPYDIFYLIWKLSWMFGAHYCHVSVAYEELCSNPRRELPRLLSAAGLPSADPAPLMRLISPTPTSRWREYAPPEWFEAREARCETLLRMECPPTDAPVPAIATRAPSVVSR